MTKNKIIVFGKEGHVFSDLLKNTGLIVVKDSPDFIISWGGDGTLMLSEDKYPGIPKIVLKNSRICKLCSPFGNDEILKKVSEGKYKIENSYKLIAKANNIEIQALNDITVHNSDPRHALRYKYAINDKWHTHEIIGDGVVVSTPLGSTGYYRSITDSFFELGIGFAFNNSTEQSDHMVLKENSKIEIEITRGPAVVFADNQNKKITLKIGDIVTIEKSKDVAKIVRVK